MLLFLVSIFIFVYLLFKDENNLSLYLLYAKIIETNSLYNRYFKGEEWDVVKRARFWKEASGRLKACSVDDDFMRKVSEDKDCTEFLLEIILKRRDLKVKKVQG